jgi:hypothetical protein
MSTIKCSRCNLVNPATVHNCRRCAGMLGHPTYTGPVSPRDRARRSSPLWPLLALTLVGAGVYYVVTGAGRSIEAVQPTVHPAGGPTSRQAVQQQQTNAYKTAVQNSNGLAVSQKRNEETKQLMQANK